MEVLVYFDPVTGQVSALSTEIQNNNLSTIAVELADVENLVNGLEIFDQYRVTLDAVTKKFSLKKVNSYDLQSLRDPIFKIPTTNKPINDIDLTVIQDCINSKWSIHINKEVFQSLLNTQESILNRTMNLYITEKNDPNILHSTLSFCFEQFRGSNQIDFELVDVPPTVSVYCKKYFTSYIHIIK